MCKKKDITGVRFGKLVAICFDSEYRYPGGSRTERWLCKCDCGNTVSVLRKGLLSGNTKSCGCSISEINRKRLTVHGGKGTKLYEVWCSIKGRCYNGKNRAFKHYGARGIAMCDEWRVNYASFRKWSYSNGYAEGLTIDRINVNGNYEPDNCRWVDMTVQANNRTNSIEITYNGETHTCSEWARITGINYDTLNNRYHAGMSPEDILSKGKHKTGLKKQQQI